MEDTHVCQKSPDRVGLYDVASEHQGYFTVDHARFNGYSPALLSYHAKCGTIQRVYRGVYRFRDYPHSPGEDVTAAWLAVGEDKTVVSHESALDLWDLSDVIPTAIHLTVPREQRSLARRPPPGAIIHTSTRPWEEGDVRTNSGIRLTSPARTILDAAETGTQPEQIEMAVEQALQRGWLDAGRLRIRARSRDQRIAKLVERALVRSRAGGSSEQ